MILLPLIEENGEVFGYVAKGEYTENAMCEAVRVEIGESEPVVLHYVKTRHFRWIPIPPGSGLPYGRRLEPSEPGKGAWLGTYCEL